MIISNLDADQIVARLFNSFNSNRMILFVGKDASEKELRSDICELPWSCIVTSRSEEDFGERFVTELRTTRQYCSKEDLPPHLFNRKELPIIRLYGIDGWQCNELEDEELEEVWRDKNADILLSIVMGQLDVLSQMVVIGYNPERLDEIKRVKFMLSWEESQGGNILFFGMKYQGKSIEKMKLAAEKRHYSWYDDFLVDIISVQTDNDCIREEYEYTNLETENLFYKGQKTASIRNNVLLRYRHFASLLTEKSLHEIRPLGRIQQSRWYYNFLVRSSVDGPQWYGYLPQSDYHVKRVYEDNLVNLVRNILFGKEMAREGYSTPIILEGDPGSSKSITLAALAYRIFNEKINPVIYISNQDLLFTNGSSELEELSQLMWEVEQAGKADTRILLIWDSSAYKNVTENAKNLAYQLDNRGRRFVLVCSAYRNAKNQNNYEKGKKQKNSQKWYQMQSDNSYSICKEGVHDVVLSAGCYYIYSIREMNGKEKDEFRRKTKLYSNIEDSRLPNMIKKLESERDDSIFNYYYKLITLLQPNLELGLKREQRKVSGYIQEQLNRISGIETEKIDETAIIKQALQEAGINWKSAALKELISEEQEQDQFDLGRFNICIALFSRFGLDTPYSLAIQMMYTGEKEKKAEFYSYKNNELFNLVTDSIPWIHYGENISGDFIFRFRNNLEAEIFLKNNEVYAEKQIRLVCDILDYYADYYKEYDYIDETFTHALQRLLRMIGPNTDYIPFQYGSESYGEHREILKLLHLIIQKLQKLRIEVCIPDHDASFANIEITFLREYYGSLWDRIHECDKDQLFGKKFWEVYPEIYTLESYKLRIQSLKEAVDLALTSIDSLESSNNQMISEKWHLADQINSLSVELTYCNRYLEEVQESYEEYCIAKHLDVDVELAKIHALSYPPQYHMLIKAINSNPTNGYAYNALFKLFEKEYEQSNEERQLQLLSEIRMVTDDATTLEINNRGMYGTDELSKHAAKIAQYSSKQKVTIQDILGKNCSEAFSNLFDNMLAKNNPAAINFVCQQELDEVGLSGRLANRLGDELNLLDFPETEECLSVAQIRVCERIREFMQRDEFSKCIEKDPHALYLLLRVTWMCFNKRFMQENSECQLTYMENYKWNEIRRLCDLYIACAGNNGRPLITLLYSLSIVQLNRDYVTASHIIESLNNGAFFSTPRMRVPYMICRNPGVTEKYSGTVLSTKGYSGFIKIEGIPKQLGNKTGIRFNLKNIARPTMPKEREILHDLEIGLGYTGFAVYSEEGRKKMEGKR